MFNIGDDVTVSGKVVRIEQCLGVLRVINRITIRTPSGNEIVITDSDIKTHRPKMDKE